MLEGVSNAKMEQSQENSTEVPDQPENDYIFRCSESAGENNTEFWLEKFEEAHKEEWTKIIYDQEPTNYEISTYGRVKNSQTNRLIKPALFIHVPPNPDPLVEPIVNTRIDIRINKTRRKLAIKDLIFTHFYRPLVYPEEVISQRLNVHVDDVLLRPTQNGQTFPLNREAECYRLG